MLEDAGYFFEKSIKQTCLLFHSFYCTGRSHLVFYVLFDFQIHMRVLAPILTIYGQLYAFPEILHGQYQYQQTRSNIMSYMQFTTKLSPRNAEMF